jgi:hypothetical protein
MKYVQLTLPYISTFLAFREVPFLVELIEELKRSQPQFVPQVRYFYNALFSWCKRR